MVATTRELLRNSGDQGPALQHSGERAGGRARIGRLTQACVGRHRLFDIALHGGSFLSMSRATRRRCGIASSNARCVSTVLVAAIRVYAPTGTLGEFAAGSMVTCACGEGGKSIAGFEEDQGASDALGPALIWMSASRQHARGCRDAAEWACITIN